MEINTCVKDSFSVIGKEGSTELGPGFIQRLWREVHANFKDVEPLVKRDAHGHIVGIWGAMSDFSRSFLPWEEDFSQGLYLAGVEVTDNVEPPHGWVKWTIPSYEYIYVKKDSKNKFWEVLAYMHDNDIELVGAAHDYNCQKTGRDYLYFPIKKLS